jgi:hypothetical protein
VMTPRSSCPGEECYSSPGRSYFRFSGESTLYLKDGRASRSLNLSLSPPWALRLLLQRRFLLKPVGSWLRYVRYWHSPAEINQSEIDAEKTGVGLAGMSTSTAGYTTRRYRGIAAWSTLVPLRW